MKKLLAVIIVTFLTHSCTKLDMHNISNPSYIAGNGVLIINEGNFMWGNGSLSYYSYDSVKIFNDVFSIINERPLGDVPNSVAINGEAVYIIVNNSGKIEIASLSTLKSLAVIQELNSPRNIAFTGNYKAYVTSMYSDSVTIINTKENSVSGYINLRRTSESIVVVGKKAFISNWVGGNEIMVINTDNDKVVDSVRVGVEPESMTLDINNVLWVLCNGGWQRNYFAQLMAVNTVTDEIVRQFTFSSKLDSPTSLQINGTGDTLFYLEHGVRSLSIEDAELPVSPIIPEADRMFYKLGINPVNGDILVTDAVDYQQNGYLLLYDRKGRYISENRAGIIPGSMCFKLHPDEISYKHNFNHLSAAASSGIMRKN